MNIAKGYIKYLLQNNLIDLMESSLPFLPQTTLKVKIFVQWPFGDQLFGFSRQGKFLGAKLY